MGIDHGLKRLKLHGLLFQFCLVDPVDHLIQPVAHGLQALCHDPDLVGIVVVQFQIKVALRHFLRALLQFQNPAA